MPSNAGDPTPDVSPPDASRSEPIAVAFGLCLLIVLVVALDIIFPGDVTAGVLYILPVLAGVALRSVRAIYIITPFMVVADYLFFWLGPHPSDPVVALINRTLAAIALVGVAMLVARYIRSTLAVEAQRRRLAHLVEMKTDFVRAVSHDIRGPIGAILGYVDLLLSEELGPPSPEVQARLLRGIQRSADGVLSLTDNLLNAARLDTGDFPVEIIAFDMVTLVSDVVAELDTGSRQPHAHVRLHAPDTLVVTSDPLRIRQIVLNLLSNALKFAPVGTEVDVDVEDCDVEALVRVRDHGPGIPASERERIFDSFYQAEAGRAKGGFGIGLPLARRLAHLLDGDIEMESTVGEGSVFTLRVPRESGGVREEKGERREEGERRPDPER